MADRLKSAKGSSTIPGELFGEIELALLEIDHTALFQGTCRLTKISFKAGEQEKTSGKAFKLLEGIQRLDRLQDRKPA